MTHSDYVDYSFYYDTAYSPPVGLYIFDDSGTLIDPTQHILGIDGYKLKSHELRISTPVDLPLHAVAGVFYNSNRHDISQNYLIDNLATSLEVTGRPDTWWLTQQVRLDKDKAVFGEVTYEFTDQLSLTGGIRFFKSEGNLDGFYGFGLTQSWGSSGEKNPACAANPDDFQTAPCKILDKRVTESGNSPKVNLTYRITEDAMTYVTYSEGFRPGGVNRVGILPPYKADFLKNYEVGWKTDWFDRRVRFNGAIFREDWNDFQFSFLGPNSVTQIANAGKARIKGIETDLMFAATDNLTIYCRSCVSRCRTDAGLLRCPRCQPVGCESLSGDTEGAEWPKTAHHAQIQGQPDRALHLRHGRLGGASAGCRGVYRQPLAGVAHRAARHLRQGEGLHRRELLDRRDQGALLARALPQQRLRQEG